MGTSRVDGVKAPQHRGTPRSRRVVPPRVIHKMVHLLLARVAVLDVGRVLEGRTGLLGDDFRGLSRLQGSSLSLGQAAPEAQAAPQARAAPPPQDGERLVRRVIPADNSCLFAALSHAFHGSAGRRERADELRRIVAEAVLADQLEYNEGTLGQSPESYAAWITKAENWGGGIELAVLSSHFRAEIAAFDIQTQRYALGQWLGSRE